MTTDQPATATKHEWFSTIAQLANHHGPEPLIALLGYVADDLSPELRAEALSMASSYVGSQTVLRTLAPLTTPVSPLAGE